MPPISSSSSASNAIRAPRPWPRRRRASAAWMSLLVTSTPAGRPSSTATRAGPCDSPAVSQRSMSTILPRPMRYERMRPLVSDKPLELCREDTLGLGSHDLRDELTALEHLQRRDRHHPVRGCGHDVLVRIHLDDA